MSMIAPIIVAALMTSYYLCKILLIKFFNSFSDNQWKETLTNAFTFEQKWRNSIRNRFFNAQFNYCPLIWMLHSHCNHDKIKYLNERCLQLIYNDKTLLIQRAFTKKWIGFYPPKNQINAMGWLLLVWSLFPFFTFLLQMNKWNLAIPLDAKVRQNQCI